jgi:hypothetical protein
MTQVTDVFVPIAGGVKSSRSDRMLGARSPLLMSVGEGVIQLANGIVDRFWQVIKRSGGVALPMATSTGGSLPLTWRLTTRGQSLVQLASYGAVSPAFTWSTVAQKWIPATSTQRGPVRFARSHVASGPSLDSPDFAYLPGYYATAHLDPARGAVFTLIQESSGEVIYSDSQTSAATHIKVVACAGLFTMFHTGGGTVLRCTTYDPVTFSKTSHSSVGGATVSSARRANMDAIAISPTVIKVAFQNDLDTQIRYAEYTPSTGASVGGELTDSGGNHIKADAMCWVRDLASTGHVSLVAVGGDSSSTGALGLAMLGAGAVLHYNITGGAPFSSLAIDGGQVVGSHLPVMRVTAHSRSGTAQDVLTLIELGATSTPPATVDPVRLATAAILPDPPTNIPHYAIGTTPPGSAAGATLNSLANLALTVDGVAVAAGDRILVKNQVFPSTNGIYVVTQTGSGGTPWILTRTADCDDTQDLAVDILVDVTAGTANGGKQFIRFGCPSTMETVAIVAGVPPGVPTTGTDNLFPLSTPTPGNDRSRRSVLFCSSASGAATQATWMLGLGIASAPFAMGSSKFILADYDNTPYQHQAQPLQSSFFLVELPAAGALPTPAVAPVSQANIAVGDGGGIVSAAEIRLSNVGNVAQNAAGELVTSIKVRVGGTAASSDRGVDVCRITNVAPVALGNMADVGGVLVIPGAVVTIFDGSAVTALGFHVFPEPPTVTGNLVGASTPQSLRYQTVYRWSDALGRIHRSSPSAPADVRVASGAISNTIHATTYRLGDKTVTVELYRSAANLPGVLYLIARKDNVVTGNEVVFTDTAADSDINRNELLYTTGGVQANGPLTGASEVCLHRSGTGRIFLVSMDDPRQLFFSQPDDGFAGAGFPDAFLIQRPAPVTALASFAKTLIIFDRGVFYISQSPGPDTSGRGLFPDAQEVEPETKTVQPLSVCVTPDGVFFRTSNPLDGLQMVNRALQVAPTGLDAQKYSGTVVAAAYVADQSQARFWSAFDPTVVYDPTHDVWSTFTGQGAISATVWNGVPVYAPHSGSAIVQEQAGIYTEAGQTYDLDIFSPWFSPLGATKAAVVPNMGGYFLLRDIIGIGSGQAGPTLVELRKDFDAATVIASHTGTPGPKFDWRVAGAWKLSCFQVRIRERSATAGPVINGFTVGIGPKRGLNRLPSGNVLPGT